MNILENARQLRKIIEQASASLNDATASEAPELFVTLKYDNKLISAGTRINWQGTIKRAAADLWDMEINNPINAPALWEDINYKEGYRIIPETITAGTAFSLGEIGWWKDEKYRSLIDNNVWTPDLYAPSWEKVI